MSLNYPSFVGINDHKYIIVASPRRLRAIRIASKCQELNNFTNEMTISREDDINAFTFSKAVGWLIYIQGISSLIIRYTNLAYLKTVSMEEFYIIYKIIYNPQVVNFITVLLQSCSLRFSAIFNYTIINF